MFLKIVTLNITELFWFVWFQALHARGSKNSERQKFPLLHIAMVVWINKLPQQE